MAERVDTSPSGSRSAHPIDAGHSEELRTFFIADVRGYSTFTRERGDAAAALLAKKFADLARDAVEARSGRVLELRGDEAFAVFGSTAQACRAAVELQATFGEESLADPAFQLPVGIGIDAGEAVPVEDGYRGVAVNMAARLCSSAAAGQVLVTRMVTDLAGPLEDLVFAERGRSSFKGFDEPVEVIEALAVARLGAGIPPLASEAARDGAPEALPPELDPLTPLVDRETEMRWLRGTWRQTQRGRGRILFVSGPPQIGKTRLAAEIATHVHERGSAVRYAGPGGAGTALALAAVKEAASAETPTLLVLDDVDVAGPSVSRALSESFDDLGGLPVLVLGVLRDPEASPELAALVERADERGDGHRVLAPFDLEGVRGIVRLYAGDDVTEAPVESMARASQGLPGRVHEVASDWARSQASRRLAAAAEFLSAGRERHASDLEFANNAIALKLGSLYTVGGRDVAPAEICPYKGLAPFDAADAAYFFGREKLVGELAARTVQAGILGVVGASGSGKSSSIAAGLLPSLGVGLLPGSDRWTQVSMRPGEHPMHELARSLSVDGSDPLERAVDKVASEHRLVLVVDQFEETFTTCTDEDERASFISALSAAARSPERAVVLIAIRGDHYGHLAEYPALAELLTPNHVLVGSMTREELKRSIELPARRAGLRMESALVDALVEEVADEPGGLPLLSTALVELWGMRENDWIRMEAYERTGGVKGAVSRLAEASYAELSVAEQEAARRLFLRLVVMEEGEGVSRRRVTLDELDLTRDAAAEAVISRFTQDRLLTVAGDTVEVAHEALLREWPRSVSWLEADAQDRQLRQQVMQAARQWQAGGREPSELFRGARLSAAEDWSTGHGTELNELEREFLGTSRRANEQEAERQRRVNRRLRGLLVGVAMFLVLALVAGSVALVQRGSARRSADAAKHSATVALAQSLGAQAVAEPRIDLAMLLAREAVALDPTQLATQSDLLTTLLRDPTAIRTFHWNANRNFGVAVSPDGRTVAIDDNDGNTVLEDAATGQPIGTLKADNFGFGPDGSLLTPSDGSTPGIDVHDPITLKVSRTIAIPRSIRGHDVSATGVVFTVGGDRMAVQMTRTKDTGLGPVTIWARIVQYEYASGRIVGPTIPILRSMGVVAYLPDGRRMIVAKGGATIVLDSRSGRRIRTYPAGSGIEAFTPDGKTLGWGGPAGQVRFLDLATGKVTKGIGAAGGAIVPIGFTPDGKTFITSGDDGQTILWDVGSHRIRETINGHAGPIHAQAISPNGSTLYTGSFDTLVLASDLTGRRGFVSSFVAANTDPTAGVWSLAVSPDGKTIAVGSTSGEIDLWDITTARKVQTFHAVPGIVAALSFSPDGRSLLVAGNATPYPGGPVWLRIWSVGPRPRLLRSMRGLRRIGFLTWATWSPDGKTVAATGLLQHQDPHQDGMVAEWDPATGRPLGRPVVVQGGAPTDVTFAPSGAAVAITGLNGVSEVLDPVERTVVSRFTVPGNEYTLGLAFSPDGTQLATTDWNGSIDFWDPNTGKMLGDPIPDPGQNVVASLAWSPDGRTIAIADWGDAVRLFDVASRREIGPPFVLNRQAKNTYPYLSFTPDGRNLVVSDVTGRAWIFPASLDQWEAQACQVANRNFTPAEWAEFLPDLPYQQVCPAAVP